MDIDFQMSYEKEMNILMESLLPEERRRKRFLATLMTLLAVQTEYLRQMMVKGESVPDIVAQAVSVSLSNIQAVSECDPDKIRYVGVYIYNPSDDN